MKRKVLAMMMSLTLAMAVTACGGSDTETDAADTAVEETVDDTAEADEAEAEDVAAEDATEEAEEDLGPLYSIEAAEAPDVAGTTRRNQMRLYHKKGISSQKRLEIFSFYQITNGGLL